MLSDKVLSSDLCSSLNANLWSVLDPILSAPNQLQLSFNKVLQSVLFSGVCAFP